MTQDDLFALYALEMDGRLDTHFSKIRKIVHLIRNGVSVDEALFQAGMCDNDLTEEDVSYILSVLGED